MSKAFCFRPILASSPDKSADSAGCLLGRPLVTAVLPLAAAHCPKACSALASYGRSHPWVSPSEEEARGSSLSTWAPGSSVSTSPLVGGPGLHAQRHCVSSGAGRALPEVRPHLLPSSLPRPARAPRGNESLTRHLPSGPAWFVLVPVLWLHRTLMHQHTHPMCAPNTVVRGQGMEGDSREESPVPLPSLVKSTSVSTQKRSWPAAAFSFCRRTNEADVSRAPAPQHSSEAELELEV